MKQISTLLSFLLISTFTLAQYEPGDLNKYLEPWKDPISFPVHGLSQAIEQTELIRIQEADENNAGKWLEDQKMIFPKDAQKNLTQFAFFEWNTSGMDWEATVNYDMTYTYDGMDRVKDFTRELENDAGFKLKTDFTYSYNGNGNVIQSVQTHASYIPQISSWVNFLAKDDYTYDGSGELTEKVYSESEPGSTTLVLSERWKFTYDGSGNCTEVISDLYETSNSAWESNERFVYTYDGSNRMKSFKYYFWNGSMWEASGDQEDYRYNTDGRISWVEEVETDTDEGDATNYFYHSDGRTDYSISQIRSSSTSNWENEDRTEWVYDAKNEPLYALIYAWDGSDWEKEPYSRVLYTENEPKVIPLAPSNLSVKTSFKKGDAKLYLSWDDVSDNEDGFVIHRSDNGTDFVRIDSVMMDETTFVDEDLDNTAKYYYKVTAYNNAGESDFSNVASETTLVGVAKTETSDWQLLRTQFGIRVQSDQAIERLWLTDMSGRNLSEMTLSNGDATLKTQPLDKGMYIVTAQIGGTLSSKKILVP